MTCFATIMKTTILHNLMESDGDKEQIINFRTII